MQLLSFIAFLVVSHFGVMQIFRFTTYHAYFWKALPLLIGYSALVGWLLYVLKMHEFFVWQVILASAWLFFVGRKQSKTAQALMTLVGEDADAVRFMAASAAKTSSYYAYSSFVYLIGFSLVYLSLYNT